MSNEPTQALGLNITESSDPTTANEPTTSNIDTNILSNESLDIDVASTNDSTLNDIPTENLIDNLDISSLENVIL